MIGQTVSHYRIVGQLGHGGMGVVYRAVDTKLGRGVALKFLSEALSRDHQAVTRFMLEARAASALNDPRICTIYEIDEADGRTFIAMELLEGESLHARLKRGPMALDEALACGAQVVEALQAAHARGIWHRDIKPGNIFLLPGRRAKLLDFGLAKIQEAVDADADAQTELHGLQSRPGTVVGTAAYMSPEQALGQPTDGRSDLFSFGLVLYEMVTGRRVFTGTQASVYEALLNRQPPPPSAVIGGLPDALDPVIARALQKDPAGRYQTAAEFRDDLRRLAGAPDVTAVTSAPPAQRWRWQTAGAAAAGLAAIAVAAWIAIGLVSRTPPAPAAPFLEGATFRRLTDTPGLESGASLSPDGRHLLYASRASRNWDIYRRAVEGSEVVNLTDDSPADDVDPAYSPDGTLMAFRSERDGGGIFVMDLTSRQTRRLSNFCHDPAWSPDQSSIVCATERIDVPTTRLAISPLWVLDVATGARRQLTTVDGVQPSWSPSGDRIAYWSFTPQNGIWTIPAAGGTPVAVTRDEARDWNPVWSPDGAAIFFSSFRGGATNLWRVHVNPRGGSAAGAPEPVTTPSAYAGFISFSRDGSSMAYVDQSFARNFSRRGWESTVESGTPVTSGAHVYRQPDLSPDGRRLAFASDSLIFLMDVDTGDVRRLTDSHVSRGPRWSPDGRRIAFYSTRSGANQIWAIDPDGGGLEQLTAVSNTKGVYYPVWSPDGMRMTATSLEGLTMTVDLGVPLASRTPDVLPPFPRAGASFVAWAWSPDGSHLAGWKLLADGRSAGIALYDRTSGSYRDVTAFGIFPGWIDRQRALVFAANGQLHRVDLASLEVTPIDMPSDFALDYALSRDQRWLYYALDQREGDVWLITRPAPLVPTTR
jgi:Tol biopolymer transport system component